MFFRGADYLIGEWNTCAIFFPREWIRRYEQLLQGIAIPQTGIAAPTLTVMQGFEAKKKNDSRICILYPSILHILPFHALAPPVGVEPGCHG